MFETLKESINDTLIKESKELDKISQNLSEKQISEVFESIKNCKGKIITTGNGTSGTAAKKISHTLNCVECPSFFLSPSAATHGGMGAVQSEDIVIIFSKGGRTKEVNDIVPTCKLKGTKIIAVTEAVDSYLNKESDLVLKIQVAEEADDYNLLATSSTLVTIAVFDALAIAITRFSGFSKERFAKIHPGGKVGESLKDN